MSASTVSREGHARKKTNGSPVSHLYVFIFWLWTGTWVRIRSELDPFGRFPIFHIFIKWMDVFSWARATAVRLSGCVYIFLLSPQHHLGLQPLLCSPGISSCHLTLFIVHTLSPHPLCTSVVFFVISYLLSASMAICVIPCFVFPGEYKDYLLNICAYWGSAFVILIFLLRKILLLLQPLNPDPRVYLFSPNIESRPAVLGFQWFGGTVPVDPL